MVPTTSVYRCTSLFAEGLGEFNATEDARPRSATLAALQNFFEALVFCERIAVKDPTAILENVDADTLRAFEWMYPALDSMLLLPFDWNALDHDELVSSLGSVALGVTPDDMGNREREAYPLGGLESMFLAFGLDGMGAFGTSGLDYVDHLETVAPDVAKRLNLLSQEGACAFLELLDLLVARLICDDSEITLWAVPETAYFHLFCVARAPRAAAALVYTPAIP
jgi:hypothetical protein